MRSSVPPEMAAHKTATAVAVLCAAISGGTLHLTVEHLQRMPQRKLHSVARTYWWDSSTEKKKPK